MITPDLIIQPFANSAGTADITTVPQTDADGFVNFTDGYTSYYEISLTANNSQAKAVERPVQNYLFNQMTKNAQAWQQQGYSVWYSTMSGGYSQNALVMRLGTDSIMRPYRSLVAANVADPLTSTTNWEYVQGVAEMIANVPIPSGGSGGSSAKLVTVATDFNTLTKGFFEFSTNAIAAASSNVPLYPGVTSGYAGVLEADSWTSGSVTQNWQRYTDINGHIFIRVGTGGSYGSWLNFPRVGDLQSGVFEYAVAGGTANAITAALVPAVGALTVGMEVRVQIASLNTGATTLNLNGLGALPVYSQTLVACLGGELQAGAEATFRLHTSGSWVIVNSSAGNMTARDATQVNQVPNLAQVKSLITSAALTDVDWTDITNKPALVYPNTTANLYNLELSFSSPYIDFHFASSTADYTFRIINDAINQLSFFTSSSTSTAIASFKPSAVTFTVPFIISGSQPLELLGGAVYFNDSGNTVQQGSITHATNTLNFAVSPSSGSLSVVFALYGDSAPYFKYRPTFAGNVPWDSGNLTPANYMPIVGYNYNGSLQGLTLRNSNFSSMSSITDTGTATGARAAPVVIVNGLSGAASGPAIMSFLREGSYGVLLGLDTDNILKIGGFSMSGVAYPILHTGNLITYMGAVTASMAFSAIGQYCYMYYPNVASAGTIIAGTSLYYASCDSNTTADFDTTQSPPGQWRVQGYFGGSGRNRCTLCLRVS